MTTPANQLELVAHRLREAAIATTDRCLKANLTRCADDCERVGKRNSAEVK